MILNPFKCEKCNSELQPEDIGVTTKDGGLIRVCCFCGNEVEIKLKGVLNE